MRVLVPRDISGKLESALRKAGRREVGGVLMGEHVSENVFRVKDLTVQRRGALAHFMREVGSAITPLRRFFRDTGHDYTRYNYLGEWHSHPSFPTEPSHTDSESMWEIVEDPTVGANFAVLVIARLAAGDKLEGSATAYLPGRRRLSATLEAEVDERARS